MSLKVGERVKVVCPYGEGIFEEGLTGVVESIDDEVRLIVLADAEQESEAFRND